MWWAELAEPAGRRPVVLVSRNDRHSVRSLVTVAPVTTRVRRIPSEVPLGLPEGLPRSCVANTDAIITIHKDSLTHQVGALSTVKIEQLNEALRFSLGL